MSFGPRLAIRALRFANHQDRHVGLASGLHGSANTRCLALRRGQLRVVLIPSGPSLFSRSDLAALRIEHLDVFSGARADAFQNTHTVEWLAGITANVHVRRIGADDGERLDFLFVQGEQMILVFEKYDGFLRCL